MERTLAPLNSEYLKPYHGLEALELQQVHVFFRHGDRSPIPVLQMGLDPNLWLERLQKPPPLMPLGTKYHLQELPWGHLTKRGKEQCLQLGQWLQHNYLDALKISEEELPSQIRMRSTNHLRTHMTGWYLLEGLLGSSAAAASIPITIRDEKTENLGELITNPGLSKVMQNFMESRVKPLQLPDGTIQHGKSSALREKLKGYIAKYAGLPPDESPSGVMTVLVVDAISCALIHGDPVPGIGSETDYYALKNSFAKDLMVFFQRKEIMQLGMGRLLREILETINQRTKSSSEKSPSLYLYAGHDATIMPLAACLGGKLEEWPDYTANICLELWKCTRTSDHFIRMLYNGVEMPITLINRPEDGPKAIISLQEFWEQMSYFIVSNEEVAHLHETMLMGLS